MLKTKLIGLPNLLLSKKVFPELLQSECTAENIYKSLQSLIYSNDIHDELIKVKNHLEGQGFDAAAKAISKTT
jgi:lipid A disaccharide synthetase